MEPAPFFILGLMLGIFGTLLIQAYGRRKVAKATAQLMAANQEQDLVTSELRSRVQVLEQIITDRPVRLAERIESLR